MHIYIYSLNIKIINCLVVYWHVYTHTLIYAHTNTHVFYNFFFYMYINMKSIAIE